MVADERDVIGRDDVGGSIDEENACPSWRAQAATTRLMKKAFIVVNL